MRIERWSPSVDHGHSWSLWSYFVVGASHDSCGEPGPIIKPRYLPEEAHVYSGRCELHGSFILSMMFCSGSSHNGIFFVFLMLMSIAVIELYVDMMVLFFALSLPRVK